MGCITTVFFVCWGPLVFYTILYEFLPEIFPQRSVMASVGYTLSLLIGMLTPIANPGKEKEERNKTGKVEPECLSIKA